MKLRELEVWEMEEVSGGHPLAPIIWASAYAIAAVATAVSYRIVVDGNNKRDTNVSVNICTPSNPTGR
ncbi:MAG: hypothetical protein N2318_01620 [Meiothermus sp.]|uniref:hypothetical protein n=1 Tax=Meiothermus sp. TaxID=1955249 RepID=UPI00298F22E2|nr:hypothetical protein [Meiothermus sp.]MCX7782323.1 hypothetical protein [Meiothermus sp.]MDW8482295.1 hypothetical protein [Meiothermus sp.]